MSKRIKRGDTCRIISGLGRHKSPNIGKIVTVGAHQLGARGQDSIYGPVHHCVGEGVVQYGENGEHVVTGWADIPLAWLEPADEPAKKFTTKESLGLTS